MSDYNKLFKRAWCDMPGHVVVGYGIKEYGYNLEDARQLLIDLAAAVREAEKPVDPFDKWWADNRRKDWFSNEDLAKAAFTEGRATTKEKSL